jgi:hypothetical protein
MSVNGERAPREDYPWPGADPAALEVACARIARQLAQVKARVIGFLPVSGAVTAAGRGGPLGRRVLRSALRSAGHGPRAGASSRGAMLGDLAPALARVAGALNVFVNGDVGFIGSWRGWRRAHPDVDIGAPRTPLRIREVLPRVLEVAPPSCNEAPAAAQALRQALHALAPDVSRVLVDLGDYGPPGTIPTVVELVDGVVAVVVPRQDWADDVDALVSLLPAAKNLGAILIG